MTASKTPSGPAGAQEPRSRAARRTSPRAVPTVRGGHEERERERPTLHGYAREHIERYQGTGKRGYRQETRDEERRLLERYALRHFDSGKLLDAVKPRDVADFPAGSRASRRGAAARFPTPRFATRLNPWWRALRPRGARG